MSERVPILFFGRVVRYSTHERSFARLQYIIMHEVVWNPSIADTIGTNNFVPHTCSKVSLTPNSLASGIFLVGIVCKIRLLSTTWLRF